MNEAPRAMNGMQMAQGWVSTFLLRQSQAFAGGRHHPFEQVITGFDPLGVETFASEILMGLASTGSARPGWPRLRVARGGRPAGIRRHKTPMYACQSRLAETATLASRSHDWPRGEFSEKRAKRA